MSSSCSSTLYLTRESVPRSRMAAFTQAARNLLAEAYPFVRCCDFGHWGDGGTHLNLVWTETGAQRVAADLVPELQARIYDLAVKLKKALGDDYVGMTMRGMPGWGMSGAPFVTMVNAFGVLCLFLLLGGLILFVDRKLARRNATA